jgi:hypothetical protein
MATYTDSLGFNKGTAAAYVDNGLHKVTVLEVTLDFAAITAARLAAGATALTSGDVLEVLRIPAKSQVLNVGVDVTKAEGGTLTIDVGDGADPDGFLDGVNANTVAGYSSSTVTLVEGAPNTLSPAFGFGKYYGAADTIDVTTVNAADVAVMRVWAIVADCN